MSKELQAQIKLGQKADRKVVKKILATYSSDVSGLDMPNFARVRRSLERWLDELRVPPTADTLPDAAIDAKEDFAAVSDQSLREAKQSVQQAVDALEQFLGSGSSGDGWRKHLKLADLKAQLKEEKPDIEAVEAVHRHFSRDYRGMEMSEFVSVRDALAAWLPKLRLSHDPDAEKTFQQQLDALASALRAHHTSQKPPDLEKAAIALAWLEDRGLAPEIVQVARENYWKPNLFLEIDDEVVVYGFYEKINDRERVNESRGETRVTGTNQTVGQTAARLIPYEQVGVIYNDLEAVTHSRTTSYASQATINGRAETHIRAIKQISIGRRGFTDYPATAAATTTSQTTSINSANPDAVSERVDQNRAASNARASRQAEARMRKRLDERSAKQVADANSDYHRRFVRPLTDQDAFPNVLRFRTSKDTLFVTSMQSKGPLLAALGEPPQAPQGKAMTLRVHESWLNNTNLAMYAKRTVTEKEFRDETTNMLGRTPERLKRKSESPPWTITFANQRPFTVDFGTDSVLIALRGTSFRSGDSPPRNQPMDIVAFYRTAKDASGPKLVRQGQLQVLPPKLIAKLDKDGDGWLNPDEERSVKPGSLTAQQSSLRGELTESFGNLLDKEIEPEPFKMTGRWESLGQLKPDHLAVQEGWMTLGYFVDRTPSKKDSQETAKRAKN